MKHDSRFRRLPALLLLILSLPWLSCEGTSTELPADYGGDPEAHGLFAPGTQVTAYAKNFQPPHPDFPPKITKAGAAGKVRVLLQRDSLTLVTATAPDGTVAWWEDVIFRKGDHPYQLAPKDFQSPAALEGILRDRQASSEEWMNEYWIGVPGTAKLIKVESDGRFSLSGLPSGKHRIQVTKRQRGDSLEEFSTQGMVSWTSCALEEGVTKDVDTLWLDLDPQDETMTLSAGCD